jgi:hypothetical protein
MPARRELVRKEVVRFFGTGTPPEVGKVNKEA